MKTHFRKDKHDWDQDESRLRNINVFQTTFSLFIVHTTPNFSFKKQRLAFYQVNLSYINLCVIMPELNR